MTIGGIGFGPGCGPNKNAPCPGAAVKVCRSEADPCTNADVGVSDVVWGGMEITATLSASASAPAGGYEVRVVSAGATGKGFLARPRQSSTGSSGPLEIVVFR